MRALVLTFVRLGPALVYAVASIFAASILLLAAYPSSAFAWALYLTILPVLRTPMMLLLDVQGVEVAGVVVVMASFAIFGVYLELHKKRLLRLRFIHAHSALLVLVLANSGASSAQASLIGLSLPRLLNGDWSVWAPATMLGTTLLGLVCATCFATHVDIIQRMRMRANIDRMLSRQVRSFMSHN